MRRLERRMLNVEKYKFPTKCSSATHEIQNYGNARQTRAKYIKLLSQRIRDFFHQQPAWVAKLFRNTSKVAIRLLCIYYVVLDSNSLIVIFCEWRFFFAAWKVIWKLIGIWKWNEQRFFQYCTCTVYSVHSSKTKNIWPKAFASMAY